MMPAIAPMHFWYKRKCSWIEICPTRKMKSDLDFLYSILRLSMEKEKYCLECQNMQRTQKLMCSDHKINLHSL